MTLRPALICAILCLTAPATAGEPDGFFSELGELIRDDAMNMPTLGGRIFWGDVQHFRGWRIQENVVTGHFRLLDPADRRFVSGTRGDCVAALDAIKRERGLQPLSGKAVIFIHGMGRSSKSWPKLSKRLEEQGYVVVAFDYPSTRCAITDSAEYLSQVIDSLDGVEQIDFVCHSMGGLVVRAYLAKHQDDRIHRMVMLAVPNLGAEMADLITKWPLYRWVCGPGGCELGTDPEGIIAALPTPDCEFAVIAAGRGTIDGYNPIIPGDDDGTITVASTRLPGAADFLQVNGLLHSFLMFDERVVSATVRFLETGKLREEGERRPIPREEIESDATGEPVASDRS